MLYTSYISNLKNIPEKSIKLVIMRYLPKGFNVKDFKIISYKNCFHAPILSPSPELLENYKKTKNWDDYVVTFESEMDNKKVYEYLKKIQIALDAGNDVFLICCEKYPEKCHRTLVAEMLKKVGYNYEEF